MKWSENKGFPLKTVWNKSINKLNPRVSFFIFQIFHQNAQPHNNSKNSKVVRVEPKKKIKPIKGKKVSLWEARAYFL